VDQCIGEKCTQNVSLKTGSEGSTWETYCGWKDNIKMNVKGIRCKVVGWLHVAQDSVDSVVLVNIRVP
jgi:hypothetical protein